MTDISAGGQAIVLKFWQFVLLQQRYNLCTIHSEHSFLGVTDLVSDFRVVRLWNLAECISKEDALKHLLPVLRNLLSLHAIFVSSIPGKSKRKKT